MRTLLASAAITAAFLAPGSAHAALTVFQTYVGNYGVSTAGWGSTTQQGTILASVPVGATVVAAYLYSSNFGGGIANNGTFNGNAFSYTALPQNGFFLQAGRADVTGIVKAVIDGGAGGVYGFGVTEESEGQDGEALAVVYQLAGLPTSTIGILDGFASVTGDRATFNFSTPIDPTAAGYTATMALGIGFSNDGTGCGYGGQTSSVAVNGTTITNSAGCNDSSVDVVADNGNLITVGGFINGVNPADLLPVAADHEMYNLVPHINMGDTSIIVDTINQSGDDNVFLAVFHLTGDAGPTTPPVDPPGPPGVPEPASLALLGLGLLGAYRMRRKAKAATRP